MDEPLITMPLSQYEAMKLRVESAEHDAQIAMTNLEIVAERNRELSDMVKNLTTQVRHLSGQDTKE